MKTKSPDFVSKCRVLSFPWMERRAKRSNKMDRKVPEGQMEYSSVLTFQPPNIEFTSASNDLTFPLIQMMNGKEPVVWEDGETQVACGMKETMTNNRNKTVSTRSSTCSSQTLPVNKTVPKSRIPRPKNAFILYRSHVSQLLKETMAFKVRESNISSLVSEMWKKESDVVHAYYAKRAALEWVKYMKRLQQERCTQNTDHSEAKSPTPSASFQTVLSPSPEAQQNTISYPNLSFSSPTPSPIEENLVTMPYSDPFFGTMMYNLSPNTTDLNFANIDTSALLSSPRSSNEDFFDPVSRDARVTEVPGYLYTDKTSPSSFYFYKDPSLSPLYNMSQVNTNYGYSFFNPSLHVFPTNTYPCVTGTTLGLDTGMRWPGLVSTPTPWPVNMA